jgi:allantoinase
VKELDTLLRAERVVTSAGERPAAVGVRGGRIEVVDDLDAPLVAVEEVRVDAGRVLMPGLVDTHVHLQDPGHTDWEDFDSGTRAAARGGITTLIDMPLDSLPVTVDVDALKLKVHAATGRIHVDVGFWGGVTPTNLHLLADLYDAGVFGFKCYLANTGLDEFPPISADVLESALRQLDRFGGLLLVHAEDGDALDRAPATGGRTYRHFLDAHPVSIEVTAVARVIEAVRATGGRAHIVHVSSSAAAARIERAHREGLAISGETCPHYLAISCDEVPDGDTSFKVCPPIRDRSNREELWRLVGSGTLGMVVSDHSPCAIEHKNVDTGDFGAAFGGVSSLQVSLPVVWTEARRRGFAVADVARWMSSKPAELAGLGHKGAIAPGRDADFCVLAPDESFVVRPEDLHHRQPITPYAGRELSGRVVETWLRGERVRFDQPRGRVLDRRRVPPSAA